jgi:hypothetical protein
MEDAMTNDPTTAADGNAYPGMMGDGTEEQNLNQRGNPSARITEDEVQTAFAGKANGDAKTVAAKASRAAGKVAAEARSFARSVKDEADDYYD